MDIKKHIPYLLILFVLTLSPASEALEYNQIPFYSKYNSGSTTQRDTETRYDESLGPIRENSEYLLQVPDNRTIHGKSASAEEFNRLKRINVRLKREYEALVKEQKQLKTDIWKFNKKRKKRSSRTIRQKRQFRQRKQNLKEKFDDYRKRETELNMEWSKFNKTRSK